MEDSDGDPMHVQQATLVDMNVVLNTETGNRMTMMAPRGQHAFFVARPSVVAAKSSFKHLQSIHFGDIVYNIRLINWMKYYY